MRRATLRNEVLAILAAGALGIATRAPGQELHLFPERRPGPPTWDPGPGVESGFEVPRRSLPWNDAWRSRCYYYWRNWYASLPVTAGLTYAF